jgi:hypothetical protein
MDSKPSDNHGLAWKDSLPQIKPEVVWVVGGVKPAFLRK